MMSDDEIREGHAAPGGDGDDEMDGGDGLLYDDPGVEYEELVLELDRRSGLLTLTLDRPQVRNALNDVLVDELSDALAWADASGAVRVALIRGAGSDFCAGADLQALEAMMEADVEEHMADADALGDLFLIIRRIGIPVVAAVHGHAVGGGCGLATACDIVVASKDARLGYPEVTIGFVPALVMAMLRRGVGEKRAFDLMASGRIIDADTAHDYGLVQHVLPAADFEESARELAVELTGHSATALALIKRLLYGTEGHSFEAAIRSGAELNAIARLTEDYRAGVRRFLESRKKKSGESGRGKRST